MKSFEGYLKQTAGDTYLLLAGGGIKPLSDFWTTTNPLGNSTGNYVLKTGDTMTGRLVIGIDNDAEASSNASGSLMIGTASGLHLLLDANEIISASNTSAGRLHLQYNGGELLIGGDSNVSTSIYGATTIYTGPLILAYDSDVSNSSTSGSLIIGTSSLSIGIDANEIISRSGNSAGTLYLQNEGGTLDIGASTILVHGGIINFDNYGAICRSRTTAWGSGRNLPGLQDSTGSIGIFTRFAGNDDGGIIISPDTCIVFNSHDTGWGFAVHDKDLAGDLTNESSRAFGVNQSHQAWSLSGYINGSDERLKFNIKEINDESLLPLKQFNRKSDGVLTYGFIALELEAIGHNELVVDGTYKSVDYNSALSLCIAQLSNIIKRNNININDRINMLEKRIHNLETPPLLIIKQRKEVYYEAA